MKYSLRMASEEMTGVPWPFAKDLEAFSRLLAQEGLRAALVFLSGRTPHRYTGVFRFDGEMLRNVALVDKWDPAITQGEDVPIAAAYCAHLHRTGEPLEVDDGASDPRAPWMRGSPIVSYCGAVILDAAGQPWGALCHFDTARCEPKNSDMPLLIAAAKIIHEAAVAAVGRSDGSARRGDVEVCTPGLEPHSHATLVSAGG